MITKQMYKVKNKEIYDEGEGCKFDVCVRIVKSGCLLAATYSYNYLPIV